MFGPAMYEEPEPGDTRDESATDPKQRAKEKADECRIHSELYAVFEGTRKFNSEVRTLDASLARDIQRRIGKFEKEKSPETPLLPHPLWAKAAKMLDLPRTGALTTNDYHISRRPGEVMMARWLAGEQVATFYDRFQAHFDAGFTQYRQEERQSIGWKQDPGTQAYLDALDAIQFKMADCYLRSVVISHGAFFLSTMVTDEMDISHLCEYVMALPAAEIVGEASAPPDDPSEKDRAWFFKLFSLRGLVEKTEAMFFFAYLQKSDESW